MEPEKLALIIEFLSSEMSTIAIKHGGTIDKFIGDALMVFGDPETLGETDDALVYRNGLDAGKSKGIANTGGALGRRYIS